MEILYKVSLVSRGLWGWGEYLLFALGVVSFVCFRFQCFNICDQNQTPTARGPSAHRLPIGRALVRTYRLVLPCLHTKPLACRMHSPTAQPCTRQSGTSRALLPEHEWDIVFFSHNLKPICNYAPINTHTPQMDRRADAPPDSSTPPNRTG